MNRNARQDADSRRFRLFGINFTINFLEKVAYKSLYMGNTAPDVCFRGWGSCFRGNTAWGLCFRGNMAGTWVVGSCFHVFPLETRTRGSRVSGVLGPFLWKRGSRVSCFRRGGVRCREAGVFPACWGCFSGKAGLALTYM
jgi:hypothetical protein